MISLYNIYVKKYEKEPPKDTKLYKWKKQLETKVCHCKGVKKNKDCPKKKEMLKKLKKI